MEGEDRMDQLFYPKSVVVIGVSERPDNLARNIVENLFEFQFDGEIHLVGKRGGILFGRRIYTSLDPLPEGIDVAVILTPAQTIPDLIEACGQKRIPWVIIETGGFGEYSEEGAQLERKVLEIAQKWGIRIVGPNGIGVANIHNGFVVPFVKMKRGPVSKGKLSILSQSGGVLLTYANLMVSANVGLSKLVSMGNKLDLNEIDYLKYLIEDPETEIIGLYLESLEHGRELMDIARSTTKPIIVHKANTGEGSRQIAKFHTAALANDDKVVEAALRQVDIIRTKDFRSFVNAVKILSLPPCQGRNLAIVSRSGGIGVVAADSAERHGFRLIPPDPKLLQQFYSLFRAKVIQPTNPLDLGDLFNFDLYTTILEKGLQFPAVHAILFMHGATGEEKEPSRKFIQAVKELSSRYQKPVAFLYNTDEEELAYIKRTIDFPIFTEPEDALAALAISRDHYRRLTSSKEKPPLFPMDRARISSILKQAIQKKRDLLLPEAMEVIQACGISVAESTTVHHKEELEEALHKIGFPVAMKMVSSEISHKSDVGGVVLNIDSLHKAEEAFEKMMALTPENRWGVFVQKMVLNGKEVIVGAKRDPSFGPVLLFGLGGIYVEVLQETSLRVAPIHRSEAEEMVSELKGSAILKGIRGEPPRDMEALTEILLRVSQLMVEFSEIEGIDINPVMALEKGAIAVDARIIVSREIRA
jgi:acetyltransferase